MPIPKVVHQLWKKDVVPARWRAAVRSVRRYHKGFLYRLWTDDAMDRHVAERHPELYRMYSAFEHHIMRVDTFRYMLMHDFGGVYCDLDYEFVRPYVYDGAEVVLSLEADEQYGDDRNLIANYFFASTPGHALWRDILTNLAASPPVGASHEIGGLTGSGLVSRVYFTDRSRYAGVRLTAKPVFSPRRVHGRRERKFYVNSGITYGFHHGWGTWRERWSAAWIVRRLRKMLRWEELQRRTGWGLPAHDREGGR